MWKGKQVREGISGAARGLVLLVRSSLGPAMQNLLNLLQLTPARTFFKGQLKFVVRMKYCFQDIGCLQENVPENGWTYSLAVFFTGKT